MALPTGPGPSWAALVEALVSTRTDHATARFDEVLAAAEAEGVIDGPTARSLRWWQRQSVQAVADHVAAVLPATIERMAAADAEARAAVEAAGRSWSAVLPQPKAAAVGDEPSAGPAGRPGRAEHEPSDPQDPQDRGTFGTVTELPMRTPVEPDGPPEPPHRPGPGFTSSLLLDGGGDPSGRTSVTPPGDNGAPPARLLAGGLTVLGDGPEGPPPQTEVR